MPTRGIYSDVAKLTLPYNNYTLESVKELVLDPQRVKKLVSKLHVHPVNYAAKRVHTRRALSSIMINSHQETISGLQPS